MMEVSAALRGRERLPTAWPVQEPGPPNEAGQQQTDKSGFTCCQMKL